MKRIFIMSLAMGCYMVMCGQIIQTTIRITGNKARITVKATGGTVGNPVALPVSNMVFSVAIPVANASAVMTAATLDPARVPSALAAIGTYTDAIYKYFNLTYTGATAPTTFVDETPYDIIELTFTGSTHAPVSLTTLPDGNPAAPSSPSNWYNYIEVGGIGYSDPPNMFYQSANTNTPQNLATDYSNGISSITTNVDVSLPVSLLNFSGYKNGGKNTLNWTVASEVNNLGFDVQRSTDGANYTSIGFVNSLAPGGMSSSNISYTFDDNNPVGKKQYYRLNQKDIDGHSKLSNIVVINGDKPKTLEIGGLFPNPASTLINVIIETPKRDDVTIVMRDMSGKTVKQQLVNVDIGSNTVAVDVANLASGSYLIKLLCKTSECETAVGKFNKQ